jgi:hypothetical protein
MVETRDHFDRTPSNVVWYSQTMLLEPCQYPGTLMFQHIDTRAFHRLASLSKPELFRFGIYVLELRERHALP